MLNTLENVKGAATVLLETNGRFVVYQPGLALIASGDSAEKAYRKFSDAKRTFFDEIQRAGFSASMVIGSSIPAEKKMDVKNVRVGSSRGYLLS